MSRNRKRTHGHIGRRIAYAATNGALGQQPQRNRRIDRPVRDAAAPTPQQRRITAVHRATIARLLADARGATVDRSVLRDAMPDHGNRRTGGGRRGSEALRSTLSVWERLGWIRRNVETDTITVLNRAALCDYADHVDPPPITPEHVTQPPEVERPNGRGHRSRAGRGDQRRRLADCYAPGG
jgi:hypothetical protein